MHRQEARDAAAGQCWNRCDRHLGIKDACSHVDGQPFGYACCMEFWIR
jgi:hypothetical protein